MTKRQARRIVDALHGLAAANCLHFKGSQELTAIYEENVRTAGRHIYVADKLTCGWVDCWSVYRDLVERYGRKGPIFLDCEDAACAHAGFLAATCHKGVYVGLVPGKSISHAICGADTDTPDKDNAASGANIRIIDPARWYGMPPMPAYSDIVWRKLS